MNGSETSASDADVADLLAERAITDLLYRYCRALDRMDRDLALSIWHPDGTADYGSAEVGGTPSEMVEGFWAYQLEFERHSHNLTNRIIEVRGATAVSESYSVVMLREPARDGVVRERVVRGRFLDRWSCRDGRWGLDHRQFVMDFAGTLEYPEAEATASPLSTRDESDPSYELFRRA